MRALVVAAAMILTTLSMSACATPESNKEQGDSPQESQAEEKTTDEKKATNTQQQTKTDTDSQQNLRLGDTATFRLGDKVTVYSYTSPVQPTNPGVWTPKPGTQYAAIDVEGCTGTEPGENSNTMAFNPFFFSLQMPDNTRIQPTVGVVEPALNAAELPLGECLRGNVSFEVPQGQPPSYVVLNNPPAKWAIE